MTGLEKMVRICNPSPTVDVHIQKMIAARECPLRRFDDEQIVKLVRHRQ